MVVQPASFATVAPRRYHPRTLSPHAATDALVAGAWTALALDGLWQLRREQPARATLAPALSRPWRPSRAVQGVVLAGALAAAGALEAVTGRAAFRPGLALLGLACVAAGLVLHLRARRALGPLWSGMIEVRPDQTVVEVGPYGWVRHPIYLAVVLLAVGSFLAHVSVATACIAGGLVAGLALKIRLEEQALARILGAAYERYAARVPAVLPDVGPGLEAVGRLVDARRRRYALVFGAILWAGWLTSLLAGPGLLDLTGQVKGTDFVEFYAAGRIVARGQADRLYDLELQRRVEHEVTAPQDWPGLHGFLNPPFFALPFVPFALLPYPLAFGLWSLAGIALLIATLAAVTDRWRATLPWVLAFVPVFAGVSYGQNSLLSLAILAGTFVLLRAGRDTAAGVVLGGLLYKPQLVVVLALALLADRRWRTLVGLGVTGIALAGVSWTMSPPGARAYVALSHAFPTMLADPGFPTWNMHSVYSFCWLLAPGSPPLAGGLALAGSATVLVIARRLQPAYTPPTLARWYAVALWATALASPHLFLYDLSILVLAGVLVWRDEPLWLGGVAVLWVTLVFSGPLTRLQLEMTGAALQLSVPVLAVVGARLLRDARG